MIETFDKNIKIIRFPWQLMWKGNDEKCFYFHNQFSFGDGRKETKSQKVSFSIGVTRVKPLFSFKYNEKMSYVKSTILMSLKINVLVLFILYINIRLSLMNKNVM